MSCTVPRTSRTISSALLLSFAEKQLAQKGGPACPALQYQQSLPKRLAIRCIRMSMSKVNLSPFVIAWTLEQAVARSERIAKILEPDMPADLP